MGNNLGDLFTNSSGHTALPTSLHVNDHEKRVNEVSYSFL
jgi:hypothetical protein